jgi:arabinosaccharide transport system substrate-binding protein
MCHTGLLSDRMSFPPGKPLLVMLMLAVAAGIVVAAHSTPPRPDLLVWVFADEHFRAYSLPLPDGQESLTDRYQKLTGLSIGVDLIGTQAEDIRLVSLFMDQAKGADLPDLCEVEIGSVGKYFRPPVDQVGFLPLNQYLEHDNLMDKFVASRFAPWSKRDPRTGQLVIFGIPHDLHPVTLTYRKDLFDQAGIDPSTAKTWSQFQNLCLSYMAWQNSHGHGDRAAMGIPSSSPDLLLNMLLQRHVNLVDPDNHQFLDDPLVADTLAFYTRLVAGPRRIGADATPGTAGFVRDLDEGSIAAVMTPDWQVSAIAQYAPDLAGKLRMMPLPRFDPNHDSPTSTWGGTMIGIPRQCRDPDAAWRLLKYLYLSPDGLDAQRQVTGILPAVRSAWSVAPTPDDLIYGGQSIQKLYIDMANQIPEQYVTPFTPLAQNELAYVLTRSVAYERASGDAGLPKKCSDLLHETADILKSQIQFAQDPP